MDGDFNNRTNAQWLSDLRQHAQGGAAAGELAVSGNSNEAKVPNADSHPGCVEELPGRASDEVAGSEGTRGASSRFSGSDGRLSMTYAAARR